ncbi:MAG: transposase, partial [Firmicutes bacterium]|nr:transposase [Bacillota bacterium]
FVKATVKEVGRPPYDPKDMLKLYLYGMDKGILSSRKLEHECVTEVSTTDPDARLMKQGNNGVDVSYNVQAAVDSKHKLIAGVMVLNAPNDQGQLSKVAKSVKENLDLEEMTAIADKGYHDTKDLRECHQNGITTIVAVPDAQEPDEGIDFKKEDFTYDKPNDCYRCPVGQTLKFGSEDKKTGIRRYLNIRACKNCPQRARCTKGTRRVVTRHKFADSVEQNDLNFKNNYDIYKLRQLLCEHPFGTIKRGMGIRQFLTRGKDNVAAEAALIFLCYNLKRMRTIERNVDKNTLEHTKIFETCSYFYLFVLLIRRLVKHLITPKS